MRRQGMLPRSSRRRCTLALSPLFFAREFTQHLYLGRRDGHLLSCHIQAVIAPRVPTIDEIYQDRGQACGAHHQGTNDHY